MHGPIRGLILILILFTFTLAAPLAPHNVVAITKYPPHILDRRLGTPEVGPYVERVAGAVADGFRYVGERIPNPMKFFKKVDKTAATRLAESTSTGVSTAEELDQTIRGSVRTAGSQAADEAVAGTNLGENVEDAAGVRGSVGQAQKNKNSAASDAAYKVGGQAAEMAAGAAIDLGAQTIKRRLLATVFVAGATGGVVGVETEKDHDPYWDGSRVGATSQSSPNPPPQVPNVDPKTRQEIADYLQSGTLTPEDKQQIRAAMMNPYSAFSLSDRKYFLSMLNETPGLTPEQLAAQAQSIKAKSMTPQDKDYLNENIQSRFSTGQINTEERDALLGAVDTAPLQSQKDTSHKHVFTSDQIDSIADILSQNQELTCSDLNFFMRYMQQQPGLDDAGLTKLTAAFNQAKENCMQPL